MIHWGSCWGSAWRRNLRDASSGHSDGSIQGIGQDKRRRSKGMSARWTEKQPSCALAVGSQHTLGVVRARHRLCSACRRRSWPQAAVVRTIPPPANPHGGSAGDVREGGGGGLAQGLGGWGGGGLVRAKFGAEKTWPQFLNVTDTFGTKAPAYKYRLCWYFLWAFGWLLVFPGGFWLVHR